MENGVEQFFIAVHKSLCNNIINRIYSFWHNKTYQGHEKGSEGI